MSIYAPLCALPIGEISERGSEFSRTAFERNIRSSKPSIFLVEIVANKLSSGYVANLEPTPIASTPICDFPYAATSDGTRRFIFSDREWSGDPTDSLFPNKLAIPRLNSSADIERVIPLSPEQDVRQEQTIGNFEIQNADDRCSWLFDYTIGDQSIKVRMAFDNEDSGTGRVIAEMIGDQFEANFDVIRMLVKGAATYLDKPAYNRKYAGTGGLTGDASLAGTIVPACFGECFNITPVLIQKDYWLFQFSDSPSLAVDRVKERGVPFIFDDDYPDYESLIAHEFSGTGHYATCLALSLFRVSLTAAGPAGPITADVRGNVNTAGYTDRMGEILLRLAIERAAMTTAIIDVQSFSNLPTGTVGFYTGQNDLKVSDIFNAMFKGINGWYGSDRYRPLRCGFLDEPQTKPDEWTISPEEIFSVEQVAITEPPRWKQSVLYRKNWTPMSDSDVSILLPSDVRNELIAAYAAPLTSQSGATRIRNKSAKVGADIVTYFKNGSDAQTVLNRVMSLFKEQRRELRVTMWRTGYLINNGTYGTLQFDQLGFNSGRKMVSRGLKDSGNSDQVTITLFG